MRLKFLLAVAGLLFASHAAAITIGSFDGSRSGRPFTGSSYDNIRAVLSDPANFGPAGTVNAPITIAPGIAAADAASLSGYDVFIMSEVPSLSAAEIAALTTFLLNGGDFLIVSDSGTSAAGMNAFLAAVDGSSIGSFTSGTGTTTVTGGVGSNGPFGAVGDLTNTPFRAISPGSLMQITGTSGGGNIMGEILPGALAAGAGGFLITGDVLFMDFFVPPGSINSDIDNANYFLNWFTNTVADPPTPGTPVPEPATLVLMLAGLAGASLRQRRRR